MAIKPTTQDSFEQDVLKKEGAVLVDFWAPWCGPCRMMAPILEDVDRELDGKAEIVKVNVDECDALAAQYGIVSIPTLILFRDGKPEDKRVGLLSQEGVLELLK